MCMGLGVLCAACPTYVRGVGFQPIPHAETGSAIQRDQRLWYDYASTFGLRWYADTFT